ncbi:MAG: ABC1 kinase family protein [Eggerthellaceae bacterium]|jgi:ubiquinone biosynthesis protein
MAAASDDMSRTSKALRAVAGLTLDADSRKRLRSIVAVLAKYHVLRNPEPEQLKQALEELGPTFVKLGQMVSSHADVFPVEYCNALASLRNSATPLSIDEAEDLLAQSFDGDYRDVFESIEPIPLGSASIAQVHRATLVTGETVAVKIQRKGIKEKMLDDIKLLRKAADLLEASEYMGEGFDAHVFIDELERTVKEEIDFRAEAENLREFYLNNQDRRGIVSPKVYPEYSNETVLVMEYVSGYSFEHLDKLREQLSDRDLEHIGHRIVRNYLQQMLEDGLFHADPHSANILIRGEDVVWIDLGMMGRLAKGERAMLRQMFLAVAMGDAVGLERTLLAWGHAVGEVDHARLLRDMDNLLSRYAARDIANLDLTNGINDLLSALRDQNIAMPGSFMTLARGLMTLQGTVSAISPTINIAGTLSRYLKSTFLSNADIRQKMGRELADGLYTMDKGMKIPRQVSDTLSMLEKGEMQVKISLRDLEDPVAALRRSIGVATMGIIVAGLFVGASLLCTTQMEPRILGVPVIGFFGYLCGLILAVYCVWKVQKGEREKRRRKRR